MALTLSCLFKCLQFLITNSDFRYSGLILPFVLGTGKVMYLIVV